MSFGKRRALGVGGAALAIVTLAGLGNVQSTVQPLPQVTVHRDPT